MRLRALRSLVYPAPPVAAIPLGAMPQLRPSQDARGAGEGGDVSDETAAAIERIRQATTDAYGRVPHPSNALGTWVDVLVEELQAAEERGRKHA